MNRILFGFFSILTTAQISVFNQTQYLGRWYQVYSDLFVEATFENSSLCDTADYGLYPNNTISVWNRERQYSVDGPERQIFGWAALSENASTPGELTVHLETTAFPAPYWIYQLGPVIEEKYEYSIVSDPLKLTLFVLARNVSRFFTKYNESVFEYLKKEKFDGLFNSPLLTEQDGCEYW